LHIGLNRQPVAKLSFVKQLDCILIRLTGLVTYQRTELDPIEFNLHTLLEDIAEMMASKAQLKGLEICCKLPEDLPTWTCGDADRLRQIVLNLVSNAVKFTERGQVVIQARVCHMDEHSCKLHFEVSDTGIGIPEDRRSRLFQMFSQVDASTTRRFGGTGLGLALCQRLVELFEGEIGVDSRPDQGSTFWFTATLKPTAGIQAETLVPRCLQQLHLLVVDDNATNLEITSAHLRRWGILCDVADYAPSALVMLKSAVLVLVWFLAARGAGCPSCLTCGNCHNRLPMNA